MELIADGHVGYMPTNRLKTIRIFFGNWNSLGIFTLSWKMDKLNVMFQRLDLNVIAGCETQVDWRYVPPT